MKLAGRPTGALDEGEPGPSKKAKTDLLHKNTSLVLGTQGQQSDAQKPKFGSVSAWVSSVLSQIPKNVPMDRVQQFLTTQVSPIPCSLDISSRLRLDFEQWEGQLDATGFRYERVRTDDCSGNRDHAQDSSVSNTSSASHAHGCCPNSYFIVNERLLLVGEDKAMQVGIRAATDALRSKSISLAQSHYGSLSYILAYTASGFECQFHLINQNGQVLSLDLHFDLRTMRDRAALLVQAERTVRQKQSRSRKLLQNALPRHCARCTPTGAHHDVFIYGCNLPARWRYRHVPGPRPSWLGGGLDQLNVPFDSHTVINKWARQYGPLFKIFVGHTPVIIITDPDLVKQIGTKSFMKFHNRPQPIMRFHHGNQTEFEEAGMLFAKHKFWAGIRATCEPLFHSCMLRAHAPLINQAASGLVRRLTRMPKAGAVQINNAVSGMTMEVIGGVAFGVDFRAQEDRQSPIVEHAQSLFQPPNSTGFAAMRFLMFAFPFIVPVMYRVFIWLGAKRIQQVMEAKGYIIGTSQRLLNNAREANAAAARSSSTNPTAALTKPIVPSSASPALSGTPPTNPILPQHAAPDAPPSTQLSPSEAKRGGKAPAEGYAPPWYALTRAANAATGQAGAPQPWWKLDSWLTAPAEAHYQRGRAEGGIAYKGQVPEDHSLLYSLMNARRKDDGRPLSDLHICAQAFTFVLAGYETTSTAISYALYEIARNPLVQQKLQEEVDMFGCDRELSFDDLCSFPYAEAVFLEGMRLHPPVTPFIALIRESSEDTELGGFKLPAGTKVGINVLGMHHNPKHFPDPQDFLPERFLDGPKGPPSRHLYAYLPFGVGPRKCIGHKFAMEEGVLTLVRLLQHFSFSLDAAKHGGKRLQHNSLITYSPRDGIWLDIEPRPQREQPATVSEIDLY
ncbi:hypothetical protein WJX82_009946 [Trebouxia sp. C0006]